MDELREKAHKILDLKEDLVDNRSLKELIQELNIFQIELEIQNQELREKEIQLLQSQEELSFLFNNAPIGYLVLDEEFNINKYNKIAFNIFNFRTNSKKLFIHTFLKDKNSIREFIEWTSKNSYENFRTRIVDTLGNKKYIELKHVKEYYDEKYVHLFSVSDITKEVEKKEKLRIFDTILDQLPVSVIITDEMGKMTYVNKELISNLGYKKDELIGRNPNIFKSNFTTEKEYQELWETIQSGKTWKGLFQNLTKDKKTHWMATAISPIFDESNKISNYISVEANIDEKIRMKEILKTQEDVMLIQARHAAMGEMISMIAHQWRQPLSVISTIASGLRVKKDLGILDIDNDFSDLAEIVQTTKYLSETINDFRNFFRKDKLLVKINTHEIIKKLLKLNSKVLKLNNIELKIENISKNSIETYSNELLQILVNLINNAKDALLEGTNNLETKEILIKVYDYEDGVIFEINDTAGGIPENIIDNIFEPYFTTKGPSSGTGLGLYITKTIVENHLKGTISVSNNICGALFIVKIPNL